jgi:iron complex outermembrane receptor protein
MLERMARSFLLSSALLFLGAPLAIAAEPDTPADSAVGKSDELEEIIVTATKVGETTVQKTPLAVSVFSGEALGQTNTADIAGLAELSPSLNVGVVTASPSIYIRGIGTNNVFNGSDPDVTMQVDGVYVARPFEQFSDFLDVQRIEVLRQVITSSAPSRSVAAITMRSRSACI